MPWRTRSDLWDEDVSYPSTLYSSERGEKMVPGPLWQLSPLLQPSCCARRWLGKPPATKHGDTWSLNCLHLKEGIFWYLLSLKQLIREKKWATGARNGSQAGEWFQRRKMLMNLSAPPRQRSCQPWCGMSFIKPSPRGLKIILPTLVHPGGEHRAHL